tara:strand:+ start:608 stop:1057 length:450 start_codon:yes stop_codon:yes gene_type:complete
MNYRMILGVILFSILAFGSVDDEETPCLSQSEISGAWKGSLEYGDRTISTVKLELNEDQTFEAIHYKMNSSEINFINSGTWTSECEENNEYEYGEIVSTENMNYAYLKGDAPYYRKTTVYIWKGSSGEWTLSALEGSGFAFDSDIFFKK